MWRLSLSRVWFPRAERKVADAALTAKERQVCGTFRSVRFLDVVQNQDRFMHAT